MSGKKFYAHSLPDLPLQEWQVLDEHLQNVARISKQFANVFNASDWGYAAGLWHDLGEYSKEFQEYLKKSSDGDAHIENKPGRVDHSTAGAQYAVKMYKDYGKILAYCIAGHHAGLPNGISTEESSLGARLKKVIPSYADASLEILQAKSQLVPPFQPDQKSKRAGFQISFFIRMIYSCLTDADFLDTEQFLDKNKALWRSGYPSIDILSNKLEDYLQHLAIEAVHSQVNRVRFDVLRQCKQAADWKPGLFTLTVPTGGGKTLSSLAFAMKHAIKYSKEKIIYVIPYTSIIEQNAQVFRSILVDNSVLEHHSNFEPSQEDHRSRLASENWDAPVVVTTNVQFFESFFANRSSQCRKLHNIANSVVILDEAQMLPVELLRPCMEVLREISQIYKTSVVLCTATQPALSTSTL